MEESERRQTTTANVIECGYSDWGKLTRQER